MPESDVDQICFTFNITDDDCVEDTEYFGILLSSSDEYVDIHTAAASISITDDDCKLFILTITLILMLSTVQMHYLVYKKKCTMFKRMLDMSEFVLSSLKAASREMCTLSARN